MMRRRNGEPAGNNNGHHHHNSAGAGAGSADGFGPDAALMGFHGTSDTSSPSRTSDGGFSAVSGGPLHLASRGTASTNNGVGNAHHQHHQPNKLYVSSPAPGVGLSGSGYRGHQGGGGLVGEMGDRTPLFGAPPAGAGFDARYARHGNGSGSTSGSVSALHSARSRDRRRMMGRLAVRATQPAALMMLAGVALVMMMTTTSWSGGGAGTTTSSSAGTPAAGTTGKVLAATAATASGGAAEMLAEAAVDVLSQAAAFGSAGGAGADGTSASTSGHGNIKVVQPENLGSAADGIAEVAAPASAAAGTDATATVTASAITTSADSPAKGDAGVLWLLDKDGNKKVILIPRDSDKKKATSTAGTTTTSSNTQAATKLQQKQSLLQKLGLTRKKDHKKQQKHQQQKAAEAIPAAAASAAADASSASDVVTYYYDSVVPQTAMASTGSASTAASTGTGPGQEAPMAAVPEVVYDKMGNAVKLVDLHNVGAAATSPSTAEQSNPVLASPADDAINAVADALPSNANAAAKVRKTPPTAKSAAAEEVTGAALTSPATAATATVAATKSMANSLAGASSLEAEGTTNQLIVIATVATMALFGGALVARRMRTRNFLNSCIENESLEDELAYDAANTTLGAAVGYDTFSAVGDMKWKGDLEKFDV